MENSIPQMGFNERITRGDVKEVMEMKKETIRFIIDNVKDQNCDDSLLVMINVCHINYSNNLDSRVEKISELYDLY